MLEPATFFIGVVLLILGAFRGRKATPRFNFEIVRKTIETGSVVKGIYLAGSKGEVAELFTGRIPNIRDDPLLEYVQEATKVGRLAIASSPEVNRYLKELEELKTRMEGLDRALRFRGRVMSIILALVLPVAIRVIPIVATNSVVTIGPIGELWMLAMVLLSTYFMTLDLNGMIDYKFLGMPAVLLAASNYLTSKVLEPLLLWVLINPLKFNMG